MLTVLQTLKDLIAFESITPDDAGCQTYMKKTLQALGFTIHTFDCPPVANFFARLGDKPPLLVFAGHTDVVPVGQLEKWNSPPFELTERDGRLYGRGCADMKGSLAAMLHAVASFLDASPSFSGSIGFLITSGEEGDDFDKGTPYVMHALKEQGVHIDYCIVGEPSCTHRLGDTIKIGRRGSLSARLTLHGIQGHVAYPHLADNPIHRISPVLAELATTEWDKGNAHFPPTSMQVTRIDSGSSAGNIIPGELSLDLNFRFSTEQNANTLQHHVQACFKRHGLTPDIQWRLNGEPFLTEKGRLVEAAILAIKEAANLTPELSTSGGTSDGRFIAPYGVDVIELGLINASIHQVNEWTSVADVRLLCEIYLKLCQNIF